MSYSDSPHNVLHSTSYVVTFPVGAIFQFDPNTYIVDEDVAGGTQAVSLQLISNRVLATNIDLQVSVTGGTATAIGMYHMCVGKQAYIEYTLFYDSNVLEM